MKISFAVACLLASSSALRLSDPNWGPDVNALEHCPDFDERFTLADGKTRAIPYPQVYYNCKADYQLMQKKSSDPNWGPNVNTLEHCPDFDERFTLADGKTKAIPFPQVYYNCKADYQLVQKKDPNWGPNVNSLEHCPDFDERFTLADGKTKAVPYPQVYYNCKADYQLSQKKAKADPGSDPVPAKLEATPAKPTEPAGPGIMNVEHCPDFNERFTLADGKTKGVPYPQINYNCNPDLMVQLAQKKTKDIGGDVSGLEHCPDFDERFTLTDGKTKAVAYPSPNYNCSNEYALTQNKKKDIGSDIANLQHCPDFDERFTLTDGKTKAVPYPQSGYNCNPEYAISQKDTHAGELQDVKYSI